MGVLHTPAAIRQARECQERLRRLRQGAITEADERAMAARLAADEEQSLDRHPNLRRALEPERTEQIIGMLAASLGVHPAVGIQFSCWYERCATMFQPGNFRPLP